MTVPQRKEHVCSNNVCQNFLKPGHSSSECRSDYRCKFCSGKHHSMIHQEGTGTPGQTPTATVNTTASPSTDQIPSSLLMTCQVMLTGPTGRTMVARALMDSGATMSLITNKAMRTLALKKSKTCVSIKGVKNTESVPARCLTNFVLSPIHNADLTYPVVAAAMPEVTCNLPLRSASSVKELPHLKGLPLADPQFHIPSKIDLVLGENILGKLVPSRDDKVGPEGTPIAVKTVFGWALRGEYSTNDSQSTGQAAVHTTITTLVESTDQALTKFWEGEEPSQLASTLTPEESRVQQHYAQTHVFVPSAGKYMVSLPRKPMAPELGVGNPWHQSWETAGAMHSNDSKPTNALFYIKELGRSSRQSSRSTWTLDMPGLSASKSWRHQFKTATTYPCTECARRAAPPPSSEWCLMQVLGQSTRSP